MTEIKKTLSILKVRWPEVTLIIGLTVLALFINMSWLIFRPTGTLVHILRTLGYLLFTIIGFLLITGFQCTIYMEGKKRQSPVVLLRQGKYFFWRLFILGLVYWFAWFFLNWLIFWTAKQFASTDTDFVKTAKVGNLAYLLCSILFRLLLMKPILLIFPLIIVLDCSIPQSFKMLGRCRLRDAKELIILFLISSIGLTLLWRILPYVSIQSGAYYLLAAAKTMVWRFLSLMTAVMAVRFVASQNLVYDNGSKPLDSQDSLKPSI